MEELIEKFETYIIQNNINGIWKSYIELEQITGIDIRIIINSVNNNGLIFCENSRGKITTRKMYEKYTSFWCKLLDTWTNTYR